MDIACPQCAAVYQIDGASVAPAGRKVRCAVCTTIWRVFPAGYDPGTGLPLPAAAALPQTPLPQEAPNVPGLSEDNVFAEQNRADASANAAALVSDAGEETAVESATQGPTEQQQAPPGRARLKRDPKSAQRKRNPFKGLLSWQVRAIAATLVVVAGAVVLRGTIVRHLPQTARLYAAVGLPVNLRGIEIRNFSSRIIGEGDDPVLVVDGDLVNITDRKIDVPRLHFTVLGKDGQQVFAWSAQADRNSLQPGEKLNFRRRVASPPIEGKDVSVRFLMPSDMTAGIK